MLLSPFRALQLKSPTSQMAPRLRELNHPNKRRSHRYMRLTNIQGYQLTRAHTSADAMLATKYDHVGRRE